MRQLTLSVVIPAWNAAATIGETLKSVTRQQPCPDEVIVVDDGSTDRTAQEALRAHSCVRVVTQAHAGSAAALNRGVAACGSDLLAFVDADDLWPPGRLALQRAWLARDGALDGVLGRMESFLCPSLEADVGRRYRIPAGSEAAWSAGALLVRREAFERVGRFAEELAVGFAIDWFDRARAAGVRFALPEQTVLLRRIRPGSLSHRDRHKDRAYLEVARRALGRRRAPAGATSGE